MTMVTTTSMPGWLWCTARAGIAAVMSLCATCLFCAVIDYETIPMGLVIVPFVIPSIILYLLVELKGGGVGRNVWLLFGPQQ